MSTRPEEGAAAHLWDAQNAARNVQTILTGVSRDHYLGNLLFESATERQLEVLGEALSNLRRLDPVIAERVPDIHRIIGMRNVLVHGYATVDSVTVWTAATSDVPALVPILEMLLIQVDNGPDRQPPHG